MRRRPLFLFALLGLVVALVPAACGGGSREGETAAAPPAAEELAPAEEPAAAGDPAAGGTVFAESGCGNCHTFAAAGSSGSIGPNLDDLNPDFGRVVEQVTSGGGGMPAFGDELSEQQIQDVAAYVTASTGG